MTLLLMVEQDIADDFVMRRSITPQSFKVGCEGDHNSMLYVSSKFEVYKRMAQCQLASDGLSGVIADGEPVSADVHVLQNICGRYMQVGYSQSLDGSWRIDQLIQNQSIAIAIKPGYNAGVTSNLMPE